MYNMLLKGLSKIYKHINMNQCIEASHFFFLHCFSHCVNPDVQLGRGLK